ncbi:hypothetical protein EDF67_104156 [Sphingobacterium sp. JUb78]|nr:hypothetical protein [Sphingobacterium kitahiroshimense]TCR11063.1 hypothetical protein EDF67_104156 [Sphingobacterium sp. JUb78]
MVPYIKIISIIVDWVTWRKNYGREFSMIQLVVSLIVIVFNLTQIEFSCYTTFINWRLSYVIDYVSAASVFKLRSTCK